MTCNIYDDDVTVARQENTSQCLDAVFFFLLGVDIIKKMTKVRFAFAAPVIILDTLNCSLASCVLFPFSVTFLNNIWKRAANISLTF
jgi:hypothetical protein